MKMNTKKMVTLAMLCAVSVILVILVRFPWPGAPFLEYDPADVPILIAALMYGPSTGLLVTLTVSVIQGITVSGTSGIIGIIIHILATGAYAAVSGFVYKRTASSKGLGAALIPGALTSTLLMLLWNVCFTPLFMNVPVDTVIKMLVPVFVPFNLIKTLGNGLLAGILFTILKKTKIM